MYILTIENKKGLRVQITSYGGRIVSLHAPDKEGAPGDIVHGYDCLDGYLNSNEKYFGAAIGRYGNRINRGKFLIGNKTFNLEKNDENNSLHGGSKGFHNVYWGIEQLDNQTVELKHLAKDMEDGFPGNLSVKMLYSLTDDNELKIEYFAETDKTTIVNLTNHSFFNLSANPKETINNHILQIHGGFYTPVDKGLITTGKIVSVEDTPFDFREPRMIGERVQMEHEQLLIGNGYDHNWVIDSNNSYQENSFAAKVTEPVSGRTLEVYTNEPGIQFYGGNFLNGEDVGKQGIAYNRRTAFCLETQHFPDSPNLDKPEPNRKSCKFAYGIIDDNI